MLLSSFTAIGNKLFSIRKRKGLTQAEVAERAGLSDRTYADIERGTVNMRIETVLRICRALSITPNSILMEENAPCEIQTEDVMARLNACDEKDRETALRLLAVFLDSLET